MSWGYPRARGLDSVLMGSLDGIASGNWELLEDVNRYALCLAWQDGPVIPGVRGWAPEFVGWIYIPGGNVLPGRTPAEGADPPLQVSVHLSQALSALNPTLQRHQNTTLGRHPFHSRSNHSLHPNRPGARRYSRIPMETRQRTRCGSWLSILVVFGACFEM